jgi:predicted ATPase
MIVAIQIRNYKGIQRTPWLELDPFHVLVGPNGSGKTTFLDGIEFVKSCIVNGPLAAVEERAPEYRDLTFMRRGGPIEIDLRLRFFEPPSDSLGTMHYRLALTQDEQLGIRISEELLERIEPVAKRGAGMRLLGKTSSGSDFYRRESGSYMDSFQFGPSKLALSLTPPDLQKYPTGNAVKNFLSQGVRYIQLDSRAMRQPAPATRPTDLELDGTNLPRVVGGLLRNGSGGKPSSEGRSAIKHWTEHLKFALNDLESIGWAAPRQITPSISNCVLREDSSVRAGY